MEGVTCETNGSPLESDAGKETVNSQPSKEVTFADVLCETNGSLLERDAGKEAVDGQPSKEVSFGDLLWVKLREAAWWPAQVVDETFVSSASKPSSKGSSNDVLVRLHGSYIYKYVDIHRSQAEFHTVLMKNNFSRDQILKKTLEQDLKVFNYGKPRRRKQSKSKATTKASQNRSSDENVSNKKKKQENPKTGEAHLVTPDTKTKNKRHDTEPSTPDNVALKPEELSARRVKVMQSLGLVAPSGSPYPRSQVSSPTPTALN